MHKLECLLDLMPPRWCVFVYRGGWRRSPRCAQLWSTFSSSGKMGQKRASNETSKILGHDQRTTKRFVANGQQGRMEGFKKKKKKWTYKDWRRFNHEASRNPWGAAAAIYKKKEVLRDVAEVRGWNPKLHFHYLNVQVWGLNIFSLAGR